MKRSMGKTADCSKCGQPCWPNRITCWPCSDAPAKKDRPKKPKPYNTREWKVRRDVVVARTDKCERCGVPFNGASKWLNHKLDDYESDPTLSERYMDMVDDEVEVICRSCNWQWTRSAPQRHAEARGKIERT